MTTLYLIRHAHRDVRDRTLDNGLSMKGRGQAVQIANWFESNQILLPTVLLTSPKLRCKETLQSLSEQKHLPVQVDWALEEQRPSETSSDFGARVLRWQQAWLSQKNPVTIACSHGDWIPLFVAIACGKRIDVPKGAIVRLDEQKSSQSFRVKLELC